MIPGKGTGMEGPNMARRNVRLAAGALVAAALATPVLAAPPDSIVVGMTLEPPVLDPTASPAAPIRDVTYANVYEGLTRIASDASVQPALAERWDVSPDGKVYSFHLRRGVTFSDGTPFDAAIVKFSLERATAPDSTNAQKQLFEPIEKVDTPDPLTAVVTLKRPVGEFAYSMAWPDAVMIAPASAAGNKTNPVGTGPYKLVDWKRGDHIELVKRPDYWNAAAVKLTHVTYRFIADPQAQVEAVKTGGVDAFPILAAPQSFDDLRKDSRFQAVIGNTEGKVLLALNNAKKPFNDVRVRRALNYAIDKKAVIDGGYAGFGTPIGSHYSPNDPGYVDLTQRYPYDPAKARQLLAEAGYPNGFSATLRLPPPTYARQPGEVVAAMLEDVGVKVSIEKIEFAQWLDQVFKRKDYDMTIISHVEPRDLNIYARDDYYFDYHNPEYKQVLTDAAQALDEGKRLELYKKAQTILADDAVNVWLFILPKLGVWNKNLRGMWQNYPMPTLDMTGVSWAP